MGINTADDIHHIGVIGAGQMGNGIAHVAAVAGYTVHMVDISADALEKARAAIGKNLVRQVKKGQLTQEGADQALARVSAATDLASLSGCQLVIEAATENPALKQRIFADLVQVAHPDAIIASNTSSISITDLARHTDRPGRFMGMHFMNPVPVMALVELIRGMATTDATYQLVAEVSHRMGKTTVTAVKDMPGFIVNRVLMPYINEACQALFEGIASVEDIDQAMKLGTNVPMGPLTLADFIGLDTCLAIMEVLHSGFADSKYRPSPLLRKYVEAGWLGRKSGRGFYDYSA